MKRGVCVYVLVLATTAMTVGVKASAAPLEVTTRQAHALLVDDFVAALDTYGAGLELLPASPGIKVWLDGLRDRGVNPEVLRRRLAHARARAETERTDAFVKYRKLAIEDVRALETAEVAPIPVALHAFRLDVVEDYDDVLNDNVYAYFVTTHDDILWGKVTSVFNGMDEGDSVFLSPEDRGLFGPQGEKLMPRNHTLIDYGLIESDGEDITELKKISDAIIDLAAVAIAVGHPEAGAAAAQARAEVKNLMALLVEMDDDDRLAVDTLRFTPESMAEALAGNTVYEWSQVFDRETFWTHFTYRLNFRLLR